MTDEITVRASATNNWSDCARRSAAQLFVGEIIVAGFTLRRLGQGAGAAVGTAVHAAAAMMLTEKAATGSLPPLNAATDAAIESLRQQIDAAEEVLWDAPGKGGGTANLSTAESQVVRMARVYREQVAPGVNPLLVEERLEAQVTPSLILTGQADLVAREPGVVRDLKTGQKLKSYAPQIGCYSLLARSCRDVDTTAAQIDFIPRVSVGKEQPPAQAVRVPLAAAETAALAVLAHIDRGITTFRQGDAKRRIQPGDPWAFIANPNSVLCNPKYCAAFGTDFCREHAGADNED